MLYAVLAFITVLIAGSLIYLLYRRSLATKIKKTGIRVRGIMVEVVEKPALAKDKLAGRIYLPTISFFTTEGQAIVGTPVLGFKSFNEVVVPRNVNVIYDPKKPSMFCVEIE
ncbi:MAG: hypothetical protein IPG86_19805 [Chitinophagaceae bacterium]|nr:hypothetical protein [Chitinophagaceae bacterium]